MRYAYYPGCSLHASAKEYDISWKAVCERLDIELAEMPDWSCCGTVHASTIDQLMATALAARNLSIAEEMGLEMVVPCTGCYKSLRTADEALKGNPELAAKVNAGLQTRSFRGGYGGQASSIRYSGLRRARQVG